MNADELKRIINEGQIGPADAQKIRKQIEENNISLTEQNELLRLLSEKQRCNSCCSDDFC